MNDPKTEQTNFDQDEYLSQLTPYQQLQQFVHEDRRLLVSLRTNDYLEQWSAVLSAKLTNINTAMETGQEISEMLNNTGLQDGCSDSLQNLQYSALVSKVKCYDDFFALVHSESSYEHRNRPTLNDHYSDICEERERGRQRIDHLLFRELDE